MAPVYAAVPVPATKASPAEPPRLLDRLRFALRTKHYSYRTEQAYVHWVRRFILYHAKRHPETMGGTEIEAFLTHLAVEGHVAASTQTQALCAILFLYKQVLRIELPHLDAVRAKRPKRLPVVLSCDEVRRLLAEVEGSHGLYRLMAGLMYGSGLRLMECCRLRIKDVDFDRRQLIIREAKGDKDRAVPLADAACEPLCRQIARRAELHEVDLSRGQGRVELPTALERKFPSAAFELGWQFVFASDRISQFHGPAGRGDITCTRAPWGRQLLKRPEGLGCESAPPVTHYGTHSRRTFWNREATFARCKSYWATTICRRR